MIGHFRDSREVDQPTKKRKSEELQNTNVSAAGAPTLGAFGEIKNKSSLLAMNRFGPNSFDPQFEDGSNYHSRLLKSGLNRTYNDLMIRKLIWPNDLVLRGSEKVKLLEMSHSEFFQVVIKTIRGDTT